MSGDIDGQATLDLRRHEEVLVASVRGDVDLANAGALSDRIMEGLKEQPVCVVLDLTGVRYVDSAGVHLAFDLQRRLDRQRVSLRVALPAHRPARKVLEIVELPLAMATHDGAEEALQQALAEHAGQRAAHLQRARDTRALIEQAKSVYAERHRLSPDEAFAHLRRYARTHNRRLHEVAGDLLDGSLTSLDP